MKTDKRSKRINKNIGYCLSYYRVINTVSRVKFGEIVGVSQQQIAKYEDGTNAIPIAKLLMACSALNITVDEILEKAQQDVDLQEVNKDRPGNRYLSHLIDNYCKIKSKKVRRSIFNLIKDFSNE